MNCACGAGLRERNGCIEWVSHAPDCLWLAWVATLKAEGVCAGCGHRYQVQTNRNWTELRCQKCGLRDVEFRL